MKIYEPMHRIIKEITVMIIKFLPALALMVFSAAANASVVSVHTNETTGLLTWTAEDNGFTIELIQLTPDFIRAIYEKHNFPADEIERVASYCIFGTILKNTSKQKMSYRVSDWRYTSKDRNGNMGQALPVKTKTQWLAEWKKAGITFSWTLLPAAGDFSVGDWQQGFTTIKLPRESEFDFMYKWKLGDMAYTGTIKNVKCAPESLTDI